MNFYIADTHFRHENVIKFDNRPFENMIEMENKIIENWNNKVKSSDMTYILGDFCWSKDEDVWIEILIKLNGQKTLIKGNHDLKQISSKLKNKFSDIKDYKEIKDSGYGITMCHYPIMFYKSSYNPTNYMLHGHLHNTKEQTFIEKWKKEVKDSHFLRSDACGNIINIGCMMYYMNYTPMTIEEIIKGVGVS